MAQMYPFPDDPKIPQNVSFSQVDVVKGLPFDDNTFDFIHLRFLVQYLTEKQWCENVIKELLRVTKVGGWIEIMVSFFSYFHTNVFFFSLNFLWDHKHVIHHCRNWI